MKAIDIIWIWEVNSIDASLRELNLGVNNIDSSKIKASQFWNFKSNHHKSCRIKSKTNQIKSLNPKPKLSQDPIKSQISKPNLSIALKMLSKLKSLTIYLKSKSLTIYLSCPCETMLKCDLESHCIKFENMFACCAYKHESQFKISKLQLSKQSFKIEMSINCHVKYPLGHQSFSITCQSVDLVPVASLQKSSVFDHLQNKSDPSPVSKHPF